MDTSITATNNTGMINTPVSAQQFETPSHKLDNITETINSMNAKIDLVKGDVDFNLAEIKQVFDEMKVFAKDMQMVKNEVENLKIQINKEKKKNNTLQDKVIYMESQSRQDNLLIDGIPESENESWIDCEKKVRDLLDHTMGITNVKNIKFVRCHRLGPKRTNSKPCAVIFKLHWFKDREAIWSKKTHLKNINYWIKEGFPAEINRRWSILLPIFQEARTQNKNVSLKVDNLVLEGKTYRVDTLSKLPEYFQPAKLATRTANRVTAFFQSTSPLSMFHPVEIKDPETGTIYHCGEQWLDNEKAILFKDTSTSSEIMYADTALECKNLGRNIIIMTISGSKV